MLLTRHALNIPCLMDNEKLKQFWEKIKGDLSATRFDQLQKELGATNYKWTSLQNGTKDFSPEELTTLAKFLDTSKSKLIEQYGLGMRHLSGEDILAIANAEGLQLAFVN